MAHADLQVVLGEGLVHQRMVEPDRLVDDVHRQAGVAGAHGLGEKLAGFVVEGVELSLGRQLDEDVLVRRPVDTEIFLREDVLRTAPLDRLRLAVEEGVDLRDHRKARGIGRHEGLDHVPVGNTGNAVGQDERDLEQLVEVQQRRHPAEHARAAPVARRHRRRGDNQVLDFGHVVVEFDALAVDVDDLDLDGDHAANSWPGRPDHPSRRWQDRQVVELDPVVLAVPISWSTPRTNDLWWSLPGRPRIRSE